VREQVDSARSDLPADTDDPVVNEVNIALFPVLTAALSGTVPERQLIAVARDLRDRLEGLPGVLEVDIGGDREEVMEILVDPTVLQTYQLSFEEVVATLQRNNRLVAAGMLETRAGQIVLKVPGIIERGRTCSRCLLRPWTTAWSPSATWPRCGGRSRRPKDLPGSTVSRLWPWRSRSAWAPTSSIP
jgi:multidrug efflux pump subunit AcrB